MIVDQYSTECQYEQEQRARLDDDRALWLADERPLLNIRLAPPVCAQCENWQAGRQLRLADGSIVSSPGFCTLRAAADLQQMSQDYACRCHFFVEDIPF